MAVPKRWKQKDPSDVADYWFDWTDFLADDETITDQDVVVPPVLTSLAVSHTDKTVRVRLSGGLANIDYVITCLITTDTGQQFEMDKTLKVRNRAA
jgi:hypothetical protein